MSNWTWAATYQYQNTSEAETRAFIESMKSQDGVMGVRIYTTQKNIAPAGSLKAIMVDVFNAQVYMQDEPVMFAGGNVIVMDENLHIRRCMVRENIIAIHTQQYENKAA